MNYLMSNMFFKNNNIKIVDDDFLNALQRGCYIQQLDSGFINYLSLGQCVLKTLNSKIDTMMEELEFSKIDTQTVQNLQLWKTIGRFETYNEELFLIKDKQKEWCLGATAEGLMTQLAKNSYNRTNAHINIYQITKKFRNELRAKGLMFRAKEFYMKDAYSFGNQVQTDLMYEKVKNAYLDFFQNLGLDIKVVSASNGQIGGNSSEEFFIESQYGEDEIEGKKMLEVAHIFKTGDLYSKSLDFVDGNRQFYLLNSFGIGITRLMAVLLEKSFQKDAFWGSEYFSLYDNHVVLISQDEKFKELIKEIIAKFKQSKKRCLVDDRDEKIKNKLVDAKLVCAKNILVISDKNLIDGMIELQNKQGISKILLSEIEMFL